MFLRVLPWNWYWIHCNTTELTIAKKCVRTAREKCYRDVNATNFCYRLIKRSRAFPYKHRGVRRALYRRRSTAEAAVGWQRPDSWSRFFLGRETLRDAPFIPNIQDVQKWTTAGGTISLLTHSGIVLILLGPQFKGGKVFSFGESVWWFLEFSNGKISSFSFINVNRMLNNISYGGFKDFKTIVKLKVCLPKAEMGVSGLNEQRWFSFQ